VKYKKKGRKIYTRRAKNHRIFSIYHPFRSALGTVITLVLIAVMGFVGYYSVGPILSRMRAEKENPTQTPDPFFAETTERQAESSVPSETTTASVTVTTTLLLLQQLRQLKSQILFPVLAMK